MGHLIFSWSFDSSAAIFSSGIIRGMTQEHLHLKHRRPNIKNGRARGKKPTKDQVASKQPQPDPNEHPIFTSGIIKGMTQEHFHLKHPRPNIKDGLARGKRPTKDRVASKQPQPDPNEHPIFTSVIIKGMTQEHFDL